MNKGFDITKQCPALRKNIPIAQTVPLTHQFYRIGRAEDADIPLPDRNISKRQAELDQVEFHCFLTPVSKTIRTFVNGFPIRARFPLEHGDMISFGSPEDVFLEFIDGHHTHSKHPARRFKERGGNFFLDGHHIPFPWQQRRLLVLLYRNWGRVLSYEECYDFLHDEQPPYGPAKAAIQMLIHRIRELLKTYNKDFEVLHTRSGLGCMLREDST